MKRTIPMLAGIAAALLPPIAAAHPAADVAHGVVDGVAHAFAGADHVLAMLAVGGWTALVARRGRLDLVLVPVTFVALLAAGAALALVGGFALFHGAAHGPGLGDAAALVGLVAGTGALHALGIVAGLFARRRGPGIGPRLAGLAVAGVGVAVGVAPWIAGGLA